MLEEHGRPNQTLRIWYTCTKVTVRLASFFSIIIVISMQLGCIIMVIFVVVIM